MTQARNLRWCGTVAILVALVLFTLSAAGSFHSHAGSPGDVCLVCKIHNNPVLAASAITVAGPAYPAVVPVAAVAIRSPRSPLLVSAEGRAPPACA